MTNYIKSKQLFDKLEDVGDTSAAEIQPLTKNGKEKFSLWNDDEKKFYNEGDHVEIDGQTVEVDKFMKLTDEQKKTWNRNDKVTREILYDDQEYTWDMPPSADKKLRETMNVVDSMDKDPLDYSYRVIRKKTGTKPWNIEYEVEFVGERKNESEPDPEPEIVLDEPEAVEPNDHEKKIIEAIQKNYPDYAEKSVNSLASAFVKNGVAESRAEKLVKEFLR